MECAQNYCSVHDKKGRDHTNRLDYIILALMVKIALHSNIQIWLN